MGSLIYLVAGFAVFWIVSFIFIYSIASRQRKLQCEVEMLEQLTRSDNTQQFIYESE